MGVEVKVVVAKEAYEGAKGLFDFADVVLKAAADGWQVGQDLPTIMTAALTTLVPALQGLDKVKAEYAASKKEVVYAVTLPAVDFAEKLLK